MDILVVDFEEKAANARQGGGSKAADRMRSNGKRLPRERCVFRRVLANRNTAVIGSQNYL
jgi:acetyl-CoA carboxylase carboxyltransferase component